MNRYRMWVDEVEVPVVSWELNGVSHTITDPELVAAIRSLHESSTPPGSLSIAPPPAQLCDAIETDHQGFRFPRGTL